MERDQTQEYVRYLRDECERKAYSIVMVVMRNSRADTYGAIKKILCCEVGVPSQVIISYYWSVYSIFILLEHDALSIFVFLLGDNWKEFEPWASF